MPPKKKKKEKEKKKEKGKKSGKKSGTAIKVEGTPVNETTREYFHVQIRDLENKLVRYQRKCDELEVANGQFNDKFTQMDTDKRDTIAFYKKLVESRSEEIADLNDRHIGLQQTRDSEKEQYELKIKHMRLEYQEMKDQLTSENMILGGKLASLEEFKVQKEELTAKFAMMEEELKRKDEENKEHIYTIEKKVVLDKDRLKKEMILRVNQVAAEFRKVSNKQMAETTKRTIRENVSMNAQLAKMSDKTMELIQENDELKAKKKNHRMQIELLESNEKELANKNHSNQKIIHLLTEKCRYQEEIIADLELREQEHQKLEVEVQNLRHQLASLGEEMEAVKQERDNMGQLLGTTQKDLEVDHRDKLRLEGILAQAAQALRMALRKTAPNNEDDDKNDDEDMNEIERRNNLLNQLLALLNSAAAVGLGPDPGDLGKQYKDTMENVTQASASIRRGEMLASVLGKGSTLPHYSLGDLGLIPRPKQNIPTVLERKQGLSATSRICGLRKVFTRSVGVQTVYVPKKNEMLTVQAMFYADLLGKARPGTRDTLKMDVKSCLRHIYPCH